MLEEAQGPVAPGHRVMYRILSGVVRHGESAAHLEVDADIELSPSWLEAYPRNESPGC